jgi:hypothetical protein
MELVMHKTLIKRDNYHSSAGNPTGTWLAFFNKWKNAWKSRKARSEHVKAMATLSDRMLYDIGEEDLRPLPSRSALLDRNPYTLLIDAVLNRDSVEFDPRR